MKKTPEHNMSKQAEIEKLIDLYFDGKTTVEQENYLRKSLATTEISSRAVTEAKAVMVLFATARVNGKKKRSHTHYFRIAAAVTSLIISSAVLVTLLKYESQPYEFIAFHNGVVIDDPEAVTQLMNSQLEIIAGGQDIPETSAIDQIKDIMSEIQID